MSKQSRPSIPYDVAPDYPTYDQAEAFAQDFITGAPGSYAKGERWAKYWLSGYLDVLTTQLITNIYAVVSFPPAGFMVAYADDIEGYEHFRGWILEYDPETELWTLLVSSEAVGTEEFMRLREGYKTS
ncbi:unnamed protein product [marine sediment metagenome]|uniref:Uncharacterized protein n=1 Tax=marine sediment metagenome TaxID=412755 RepID=X1RP38_9ZZZZ